MKTRELTKNFMFLIRKTKFLVGLGFNTIKRVTKYNGCTAAQKIRKQMAWYVGM